MNAEINTLGKRLQALMGDVNFWSDYDQALDSPEQLLAIGKHNLREFEKIEAMGEERYERIQNILCNILASIIQKESMEQYGNTYRSSNRQVLCGWFNRPEDRAFWDRLREAAKQALIGLDLTVEQCTAVLVHIYDKLPDMLMEVIEELTAPVHLLPRSEAQPIAMVLADMMTKEVGYANSIRDNQI